MQLRKESAALNEARDKEKPLVQEAEAKVKELQQKLDNLNSLQFNLRKEHKAMKEKTEELENNVRTFLLVSFFHVILCFLNFQMRHHRSLSSFVELCSVTSNSNLSLISL